MKKLLSVLTLFLSLNSFCQTYFPFPDSVGIWKQSSSYGNNGLPAGSTHYSLFLNGDTIINGNLYSNLYYFSQPNNIDTNSAVYFVAIREIQKRVYVYIDSNTQHSQNHFYSSLCHNFTSNPASFNTDLLLYDFNVSVGDTVFYPYLDSAKITITTIDSIKVQGQYRKRYHYSRPWLQSSCSGNATHHYVEGIGDDYSGLFSLWWGGILDNKEHLNCFEDDQVLFSNVGDCSTLGVNDKKNTLYNIQIYPNPVSNNLFIELTDYNASENLTVSLFDITGKLVYTSSLNKTTNNINTSSFNNGLYLVKISSKTTVIKTSLISVQ